MWLDRWIDGWMEMEGVCGRWEVGKREGLLKKGLRFQKKKKRDGGKELMHAWWVLFVGDASISINEGKDTRGCGKCEWCVNR